MTTPVTSSATLASADVYTDFAGLAALKKSARSNDPEALRAVAKQYESLFARMMIKSMRDAVGKDPIFGSDEEQTYQGMYDDQLSIEMTKGHGLGLADMLVRQMQRLTGGSRTDASDKTDSSRTGTAGHPISSGLQSMSHAALRRYQEQNGGSPGRSPSANVSPQAQSDFISELWPTAQEAGRQLGVDPRNLIAQAALETNWGTHVPRDAGGRSSNNLFGMKTGGQWTGAANVDIEAAIGRRDLDVEWLADPDQGLGQRPGGIERTVQAGIENRTAIDRDDIVRLRCGEADLEHVLRIFASVQGDAPPALAMGVDQGKDLAVDLCLRQCCDDEVAFPVTVTFRFPVLDGAAAADAEMRAEWFDALRACAFDPQQLPPVWMMARYGRDVDGLPGERVRNEDASPVDQRNAVTEVADMIDDDPLNHGERR